MPVTLIISIHRARQASLWGILRTGHTTVMQCECGVRVPGLACIAQRLSALRTHYYDVSLSLIKCSFVSVFEWLLSACLVNVMNSTHRQHRPTHLYLPGTLQLFFYIYIFFLKEKKYLYVQIRPWSNDKWKNETKCFVILGKKEKKEKKKRKWCSMTATHHSPNYARRCLT